MLPRFSSMCHRRPRRPRHHACGQLRGSSSSSSSCSRTTATPQRRTTPTLGPWLSWQPRRSISRAVGGAGQVAVAMRGHSLLNLALEQAMEQALEQALSARARAPDVVARRGRAARGRGHGQAAIVSDGGSAPPVAGGGARRSPFLQAGPPSPLPASEARRDEAVLARRAALRCSPAPGVHAAAAAARADAIAVGQGSGGQRLLELVLAEAEAPGDEEVCVSESANEGGQDQQEEQKHGRR